MKLPARDLVLLQLTLCPEKRSHIPGKGQGDLKRQFNGFNRHPGMIPRSRLIGNRLEIVGRAR
jgi:hypothetical protein